MENCAPLLRDASMEASPSPAAAPEALVYAKGNGTAVSAAAAPEQEQGKLYGIGGEGDDGDMRRRRFPSRNPREQRSPWTAPRARKTRRRGDHLEEHHACRIAVGAPGAPRRGREREAFLLSIAKPTTTRSSTLFSTDHLKNLLFCFKKNAQQQQKSRLLRDAPLWPLAGSSTPKITSSSRKGRVEEEEAPGPSTLGWRPSPTTAATAATNRRKQQRPRPPSLLSGRASSPAPRAGAATAASAAGKQGEDMQMKEKKRSGAGAGPSLPRRSSCSLPRRRRRRRRRSRREKSRRRRWRSTTTRNRTERAGAPPAPSSSSPVPRFIQTPRCRCLLPRPRSPVSSPPAPPAEQQRQQQELRRLGS